METNEKIKQEGKIIRLIGGLYTVKSAGSVFECKARGVFRKKGLSPTVGDNVIFSEGVIEEILPRKNELIRPPMANLDQLIFVVSTAEPAPNFYVLDQLIAASEFENIEPVIVITKNDLLVNSEIKSVYQDTGIKILETDYSDSESIEKIKFVLKGKVSAFTGNSGVGKSTLMNHIDSRLNIPTNEISLKLGRGKHTTRHVELYEVCGGLVADTPGFSSFDIVQYKKIRKDNLCDCFREFGEYKNNCRFSDCTHTCEPGCGVIEAVKNGNINKKRHENYCTMYSELKQIKEWEK